MLLAGSNLTNDQREKTAITNIKLHQPVTSLGVDGARLKQTNKDKNYLIYKKLTSKENAIEAADRFTHKRPRSDKLNVGTDDAAKILRTTKQKIHETKTSKALDIINVEDIDVESNELEQEFLKNIDGAHNTSITNRVETGTSENSDRQNDQVFSSDSSPMHDTIDDQITTANNISTEKYDDMEIDYQTFKKKRKTEQNRISQRRFRTRNKLYIQELEEKVKNLESFILEMDKLKKENDTLKSKLLSVLEELHGLNDKFKT